MHTCCNTCGRPIDKPFRLYTKQGEVLNGCVSGAHTPASPLFDQTDYLWHWRPSAMKSRETEKIMGYGLTRKEPDPTPRYF